MLPPYSAKYLGVIGKDLGILLSTFFFFTSHSLSFYTYFFLVKLSLFCEFQIEYILPSVHILSMFPSIKRISWIYSLQLKAFSL